MHPTAKYRPAPFVTLALLSAVALLLPFPGSLSVVVSRWALATTAGVPSIELVSLGAIGALALATAGSAVHAWRRHRERITGVLGACVGLVLAYGASEAAKPVLAEARPCSRWVGAAHCPPAGDWSLPSNHATVAFAALVVIAIATRSLWVTWTAAGLALLAAAGRVLEGVHYLHDVAAGAILGACLAAGLAWGAVQVHRRVRASAQAGVTAAGPGTVEP